MRAGWRANRTPGPTQALALALALVGTTCRGGRAAEAPAGASGGPLPWLPVVDEGCPADRFVDVPEVYGVTEGRTRQGGCHCHYVDIADLDEATFTAKYNSKRIPLVVTGALKHWRAMEEWTPAFFSTGVWKDVNILGSDKAGKAHLFTLDLEGNDPCTLAMRMHAMAKGDGARGKRPRDLVRFLPECEAWVAARRERFGGAEEKLKERGHFPATYAEFIEWIFDKEKEEDMYGLYIKLDKQFSQDHPELIEEYAPLTGPGAIPDWLQFTKPGQDLGREEDGTLPKHFPIQNDWHIPAWLIGATGSRTTTHLDGTGWTSWIAVIKGKKLVNLWHNEADYNATVAGKDLHEGGRDKEGADLTDYHSYSLDPFDKLPPQIKKNWARSGRSYLDQHWDPDARTAFRGNGGDPLPPMAPAQCVLKDGDLLITMDTIHSALNLEPGIALTGNALDVYGLAQFIWRGWLHGEDSPEGGPMNMYYQLYLRMCRRESTRAFKPKVLRGIRERARNARAARNEWVRYKHTRARGKLEREWAEFKGEDGPAYRELTEEDFRHLADLQEAYRGEGGDDHGEEL